MPTDQARGLKAHGTRPAKTKIGEMISFRRHRLIFLGLPCAFAGMTVNSVIGGFPTHRSLFQQSA
jgi:hypothetical protein